MEGDTLNAQAILERLERLERQNRRLKWAWTVMLLAVIPLFTQCASSEAFRHDTIQAHRFVVLGKDGKTRAELSAYDDAVLMFYDRAGTEQMTPDTDHMAFFDPSQPTGTRAPLFMQVLNREPLIWLAKDNRIIWQAPPDRER